MSTRAELKAFFETGDIPTESQFADLIDSLLHLTEDTTDNLAEGETNKFLSAANKTKLDSIEAGAQVNPTLISQAEAEAGTATTVRLWSALRVAQAIAALSGTGAGLTIDYTVKTSSFSVVFGNHYLIDTSSGALQISLPSGAVQGDEFGITDARGALTATNFARINFGLAGYRWQGVTGQSPQLEQKSKGITFVYQGSAYGWVTKFSTFS